MMPNDWGVGSPKEGLADCRYKGCALVLICVRLQVLRRIINLAEGTISKNLPDNGKNLGKALQSAGDFVPSSC
jgi:hypothetical protein